MARISAIFLAALGAVRPALSFTNGSLIPSYFCNPIPDGLPKSLGELIPFTVKDMGDSLAFNSIVTDNLNKVPMTNSQPGNTGYMLASFHNTVNSILPIIPGIGVELASGGTTLMAGQANQLVLKSLVAGKDILGILIHAVFSGTHTPAGFFTDAGGIMVPFAGCGLASTGEINGLVHSTTICQQVYGNISYHAPAFTAATSIFISGLSVTDYGFGVWNLTLQLAEATMASAHPSMSASMTHPSTSSMTHTSMMNTSRMTSTMSHMSTTSHMLTMSTTRPASMNTTRPTTSMSHMASASMSLTHMSMMNVTMGSATKGANSTGGIVVSSGASGRPRSLLRFWWR